MPKTFAQYCMIKACNCDSYVKRSKKSRKNITYGEVKVKAGTQMHSEVKKALIGTRQIVVSQAEVGIQVIRD